MVVETGASVTEFDPTMCFVPPPHAVIRSAMRTTPGSPRTFGPPRPTAAMAHERNEPAVRGKGNRRNGPYGLHFISPIKTAATGPGPLPPTGQKGTVVLPGTMEVTAWKAPGSSTPSMPALLCTARILLIAS